MKDKKINFPCPCEGKIEWKKEKEFENFEDRKETISKIKNRDIKIIYIEKEKYLKVITII